MSLLWRKMMISHLLQGNFLVLILFWLFELVLILGTNFFSQEINGHGCGSSWKQFKCLIAGQWSRKNITRLGNRANFHEFSFQCVYSQNYLPYQLQIHPTRIKLYQKQRINSHFCGIGCSILERRSDFHLKTTHIERKPFHTHQFYKILIPASEIPKHSTIN